jgi:ABC-type nitrate/sulfonate/bicarbonate transport system permease component
MRKEEAMAMVEVGRQGNRRPGARWGWLSDGRLLSFVVLLGLWQLVAQISHINPVVLPAPARILAAWGDSLARYNLLGAVGFSLETLVPGFAAAALVGIPLGIGMGLSRYVHEVFDTYVTILLSTPIVVLVPVLIVWFGLGELTRMAAAFIFAFPLIVLNSQAGVRRVSASLVEMARSFEAPPGVLFRKVVLPGALPAIMVGLRLGITHAVKGVIIAEMLMAMSGLGGLIESFGGAYRSGHLLAVVFTALIIVLAVTQCFQWLERRLTPWQADQRQAGRRI